MRLKCFSSLVLSSSSMYLKCFSTFVFSSNRVSFHCSFLSYSKLADCEHDQYYVFVNENEHSRDVKRHSSQLVASLHVHKKVSLTSRKFSYMQKEILSHFLF